MRWHSKTHGTKPVHTHTAVAVHAAEVVDLWRAIDRCKHVWVGFGLSSAGGGLKINLHAFAVAPVLQPAQPVSIWTAAAAIPLRAGPPAPPCDRLTEYVV